jgi:hypothetical protein
MRFRDGKVISMQDYPTAAEARNTIFQRVEVDAPRQ